MNDLGKQFFNVDFFNTNFSLDHEDLLYFLNGILDKDLVIGEVEVLEIPEMKELGEQSLLVWAHDENGVFYQLLVKPVLADYDTCLNAALDYLSKNALFFTTSYNNLVNGVIYMTRENLFESTEQIAELTVGSSGPVPAPEGETFKIYFFDMSSFFPPVRYDA